MRDYNRYEKLALKNKKTPNMMTSAEIEEKNELEKNFNPKTNYEIWLKNPNTISYTYQTEPLSSEGPPPPLPNSTTFPRYNNTSLFNSSSSFPPPSFALPSSPPPSFALPSSPLPYYPPSSYSSPPSSPSNKRFRTSYDTPPRGGKKRNKRRSVKKSKSSKRVHRKSSRKTNKRRR